MDLSALDSSLPAGLADAERVMGDKFRAAALSMTTLYKTSLANTKQAYQVGYSAALADVLSKVQSDIGAGEDAAVALARLMDWTEARQAAMAAFAADDDDQAQQSTRPQTSTQATGNTSQGVSLRTQSHLNGTPQRPASAPVEARARGFARDGNSTMGPGPSGSSSSVSRTAANDAMDADDARSISTSVESPLTEGPSRRPPSNAASVQPICPSSLQVTPTSADNHRAAAYAPTSSPTSSPFTQRTFAPAPKPSRGQTRMPFSTPSTSSTFPGSTFNFSIPPAFTIPSLELPPASGPAQTGPIGSKRPMIDADMAVDSPSALVASMTPTRGHPHGQRAAKRRTLGLSLNANAEDDREATAVAPTPVRASAEKRRSRRGGGRGSSPMR